jgi:predicted RND superfamily exporter protein
MKVNFKTILIILAVAFTIVAFSYLVVTQVDVKNVLKIILLSLGIAIGINCCIYYIKPELFNNKKSIVG